MKRPFKFLLVLIALGAGGSIVVLALLWIDHSRDVMLPVPTGPFAVGRITDAWTDTQHADPFAEAADARREIVVWIWYPAARSANATAADYLPVEWRNALAHRGPALLNRLLARDLARVHPHSLVDAPLAPTHARYPVVILRGGLGALIANYTTIAEDLASHGYVVVGFDAPHLTDVVVLPGGRIVTRRPEDNPETVAGAAKYRLVERLLKAWTGDVKFAVDRLHELNISAGMFHDRLDLGALGIAGHSLGGATAAEFCHDDSRCRAGIDIDGAVFGDVVHEGLRQPFLFLFSDHSHEASDPDLPVITANFRSLFAHVPPDTRTRLTVRGASHFNFSDQMLLRPTIVMRLFQAATGLHLEPRRGLAIATAYVRAFFDAHLKGMHANLLDGPSPHYPEVEFE